MVMVQSKGCAVFQPPKENSRAKGGNMISAGAFGPKLSGKTTLARHLSLEYWQTRKMRSFVLDPNGEEWGDHAWSTAEEEKFWTAVWATTDSLVIVEEAAATIRRERTLIPVFTRLRHCRHKLLVVGHNGMDLLPTMRQQFDTLYLFRQPKSACKIWAEVFTDETLLQAEQLQQYEFLYARLYQKTVKMKLNK